MTGTFATFVLEHHLGHRTFAENLQDAAASYPDLAARWVPVQYVDAPASLRRVPMPDRLRSALAGRNEVRVGIRAAPADVHVFNTQVPAALGGRVSRSRPYVVITDVTPVQYDQMAEGYGHRPDRRGPIRFLKHRLNRQVFTEASCCVGWSSWTARSIIEDYGVDPRRVSVIPPGVDTSRWLPVARAQSDIFRVLFVGGEFGRKGGEILLKAFKTLSARAELHIVTKTPIAPSDRVHVINDLGPNDPRLIELYRSSDVFVLPSLAETFGIAAVEASAMGLPVIASSSGGLSEIVVDGETGLTVVPGDADSLANAMLRLERDPELRRRLGRNARARAVERFDAGTNAARLFELVRHAAQ